MIVDASALIAIVVREPDHAQLRRKLARAQAPGMGTPTLTETAMVLGGRLGIDPRPLLARLLQEFRITPVPFGDDHWREAARAFVLYGKGRHAARLNFGDCMAYATARLAGQPLLCKGEDFARTDIEVA